MKVTSRSKKSEIINELVTSYHYDKLELVGNKQPELWVKLLKERRKTTLTIALRPSVTEQPNPMPPFEGEDTDYNNMGIDQFHDKHDAIAHHENLNDVYTEMEEKDMDGIEEPQPEEEELYTITGRIGWFKKNSRYINGYINNVPVVADGDRSDESISFTLLCEDSKLAFEKAREFKKLTGPAQIIFTKKVETWEDKKTGEPKSATKANIVSVHPVGAYGTPIDITLLGYDILA